MLKHKRTLKFIWSWGAIILNIENEKFIVKFPCEKRLKVGFKSLVENFNF